ncbi:MAG: hypothetical protein A2Y18_00800 [Clostridiales bacterium GWD2_32_19]|nr:MAG: hypothetical protein A2Y18_00800 [Clostridiales bacterium GWD2_32_19]
MKFKKENKNIKEIDKYKIRRYALKIFITFIFSIFIANAGVVFLQEYYIDRAFPISSLIIEYLLGSILLIIALFPVFYFLFYRPLVHQKNKKFEKQMFYMQKDFSQRLIQNSSAAIFVINMNHKVIIWNKACENLTGIKAKDIIGTDEQWKAFYDQKRPCMLDLVVDDSLNKFPILYSYCSKSNITPEGLHIESWYSNIGGKKRYLIAECSPVYDEVNNLIAGIETLQDVSEEKIAEEKLLENEQLFRNTFEQVAVGVLHVGLDGKLLRVNQKFCDIVGYTVDELLNMKFKDITRPDYIEGDLEHAHMLLNNEIENYTAEEKYICKDGSEVWVNLTVSVGKNISGEPQYFIAIVEDISKRKLMEHTMEEKNMKIQNELELASKVQRELLPKNLPNTNNVIFAWEFWPSVFMAGDMFNIFQINEENVGFYILDVMGHGLQAALKAVTINYFLKPTNFSGFNTKFNTVGDMYNICSPSETLNFLNEKFNYENDDGGFFTTFYGILNTKSLEMTYAKAGHCAPIVVTTDGNIIELDKGGPSVGLSKKINFKDYTIKLNPRDKVFLYTDGVIESKSPNGEAFSKKRFIESILSKREENIGTTVNKIVEEVVIHVGKQEIDDDVTLFGIQILD